VTSVLPEVAFGLAITAVALLALLGGRRIHLARRESRQADLEARTVPIALELVAGGLGEQPAKTLSRDEAEALATVLQRYGRVLTGEGRERIALFFERAGVVAKEVGLLKARQPWRRAVAAYVLGDIGSREAVDPLLEALDDRNGDVRAATTRSLGKLRAPAAVAPILRLMVDARIPVSAGSLALLEIGPPALPGLLNLVAEGSEAERLAAMELVIEMGDASHSRIFVDRLSDESSDVRARAARALGNLGAADATMELRRSLHDPNPSVRAASASSLGRIGDRESLAGLLRQAGEAEFAPARAAARAAGTIDPQRVIQEGRKAGAAPHLAEAGDRLTAGLSW
jgi:HEAT repeat protein